MSVAEGGPVRILVADDDQVFTEALTALLGEDERLDVVGQARSGAEALALADELRPNVVLMDLAMPAMAGLEATRRIREAHPETLVLILTGSAQVDDVSAASAAGASGFLTKDCLSSEIASAILGIAAFAGASHA